MTQSNIQHEGICARNNEIRQLRDFINERIKTKKSGIVYMPGGPGTGKSMCVKYVMEQIKSIPKLYINCAKFLSAKTLLTTICDEFKLKTTRRQTEKIIIDGITKHFTDAKTKSHLMVLDEIDVMPESKIKDQLTKILSWVDLKGSKLILIAIANTIDLTSRRDIIQNTLDKNISQVTRIVFRPYTSQELTQILKWYLDNDPSLDGRVVEDNVIRLLAMQFSRCRGDVRGAVNALRSSVVDTKMEEKESSPEPEGDTSIYPTPPSSPTPTQTPAKMTRARTTCPSVIKSISKRTGKRILHEEDEMPYVLQVILTCLQQLCSKTSRENITIGDCIHLVHPVLEKSNLKLCFGDIRTMLENLCAQGLIQLKKARSQINISVRISEAEFQDLVPRRDTIVSLIKALPKS